MARTVSKSSDVSSESTPVPVVDLGGHYEEHKADPADRAAALQKRAPASFKDMQDIQTADWIENLMSGSTVFASDKGSFKLAGAGYHNSIQPIAEEIRKDPYLLRAVQRGRIAFITSDEAMEKIAELKDESNTSESHMDHLRESLAAGACENTGLYKIPLPDEAEPKGPSQSWEQIWNSSTSTPKPKNV